MNPPLSSPTARANSALGWLLAGVSVGLALLATTVVFALDVQRTVLQDRQAQLVRAYSLREAESKRLVATDATAESELERLNQAYEDGKADLKRVTEARSKREPLVEQSTSLQVKVESVIVDLLILAKSDRDAQMIVTRYHIHQDAPETPTSDPTEKK
jgi:ribosome-binding ATPase YchF (GTP1/OBG family)